MSVIYGHPVMAATRALRFSDHVTKRNGGSGDDNVTTQAEIFPLTWEFKDGCSQKIFKHLRNSENCRSLCSEDCFKVLDSACTSFQLKIKEAMHIL